MLGAAGTSSTNPSSEVACLVHVHGDDFLAASEESALKQFREQLAKEWKIKHTHIGEAEHLGKHMRVLNRIVRIHPRRGITIEPDPRHGWRFRQTRDDTDDKRQYQGIRGNQTQKMSTRKQGTGRLREEATERAIMTNWTMLRSQGIVHSWPEQITSLWIVVTLPFVSKNWPVACSHHQNKTGKGFRDWQGTCDTNLGVYYGMYIKARQMKSLVSLIATGLDAKGHADPHLVDACCGSHTLSKCGVGHRPW